MPEKNDKLHQTLDKAELCYVSDEMPGYTRKPWGRGFTYQNEQGDTIRDPDLRAWIEAIVIPPAWTDVWISPHRNGHILATGRDSRGRKQYRYHPRWQEQRQLDKFDHLAAFGEYLPKIRRATDSQLRKHKLTRQKVLAIVIRLLDETLIRVGNTEYSRRNSTYGLTTLEDDHVQITGSRLEFEFVGKSSKTQKVTLKDRRLANAVRACHDIPGYELFQYVDDNGNRYVLDSSDVNEHLCRLTDRKFTAKVFRTWGASASAVRLLCAMPEAIDADDRKAQNREVAKAVAEELGNTVSVCRQYYIHPVVFEAHQQGQLQPRCAESTGIDDWLHPEETILTKLIQEDI